MQSKNDNFNELPKELEISIAYHGSKSVLGKLAQTSTYHRTLLGPMIGIRKLLHYVTRGEYDAVKAMVRKDLSLFFKRSVVTDCSEREFENISAFEYTLWALDRHMWTAMIACIPHNQEGHAVFAQLLAQYNKLNADGVTYKLNGKTVTEKHFDFNNTIIKELKTQTDSIKEGKKSWEAIQKQWREGVGGAQKLLPMHVVYEYCSDISFYPVPKFTSQPKSSRQFYDCYNALEDWFSIDSKLSVDFAIDRQSLWPKDVRVRSKQSNNNELSIELNAMTALCNVRTEDFIELKSQLNDHMILDKHQYSFLDLISPEIRLNIEKQLGWFALAQAQSVSKQWFNFFHDKPFTSGYYPQWGELYFYELFNPKLKEGTFYFTRINKEYRFYIQKRNNNYEGNKSLWVECQHFIVYKGTITVTQIDELRPLNDGELYGKRGEFDSYEDYCSTDCLMGIASKGVKIDYESLKSFLQQFLNKEPAPSNLGWKRDEFCIRFRKKPNYLPIESVCEEYERNIVSHK